MASQLPAFQGKFGSTEYFVITMKAGELVRTLTIPKEMEGWEDLTPEERFQREVNYKRVAQHIAPYLATDDDRFIGAFIVAAHQADDMIFESLESSGVKFPHGMPKSFPKQFGVLHLDGSEVLVPLDGQHRLAALKFAMEGKDNTGKEISGFQPKPEVASDVCTVILIRHDPQKSRKIFNKVNRYAKPTSKSDNLITADDDYIAVIVREKIIGNLIESRVVNTSNTLSASSGFFTTLATMYEISLAYEETITGRKVDTTKLPPGADIKLAEVNLKTFWSKFLTIKPYEVSLLNSLDSGDKQRSEIRAQSVICKPIVQRALAEAIFLLLSDEEAGGKKLGLTEIINRINTIDWNPSTPIWQGILMLGDKVITGNGAMKFAARMLAYLLGQKLEKTEITKLAEQFASSTNGKKLPEVLI
ncbi:MAG: DNA sulfur modification protein DndB [Pseudohongiella sp.]|nr:DNA sulfur modification protein DndB [Pseudohongiella sp.]